MDVATVCSCKCMQMMSFCQPLFIIVALEKEHSRVNDLSAGWVCTLIRILTMTAGRYKMPPGHKCKGTSRGVLEDRKASPPRGQANGPHRSCHSNLLSLQQTGLCPHLAVLVRVSVHTDTLDQTSRVTLTLTVDLYIYMYCHRTA